MGRVMPLPQGTCEEAFDVKCQRGEGAHSEEWHPDKGDDQKCLVALGKAGGGLVHAWAVHVL